MSKREDTRTAIRDVVLGYPVGQFFHYTDVAELAEVSEPTASNHLSDMMVAGELRKGRRGEYARTEQSEPPLTFRVMRTDSDGRPRLVVDQDGNMWKIEPFDLDAVLGG